mmetsp:Transcript_21521/g.60710  ORF Transcript_21521/g.60710 Transcript_21521/m.60710 type:complete len:240 (-) Transcript_21521:103-822(-)
MLWPVARRLSSYLRVQRTLIGRLSASPSACQNSSEAAASFSNQYWNQGPHFWPPFWRARRGGDGMRGGDGDGDLEGLGGGGGHAFRSSSSFSKDVMPKAAESASLESSSSNGGGAATGGGATASSPKLPHVWAPPFPMQAPHSSASGSGPFFRPFFGPRGNGLRRPRVPHVCAVCLLCGGHARQTVCGASLVWLASQASSGAAREKVMLAVSIKLRNALSGSEAAEHSRGGRSDSAAWE